jgi:hypothetical protein
MSTTSEGISAHTNDGRLRTITTPLRSTIRPRGAAIGINCTWFSRAASANVSPSTSCTCASRATIAIAASANTSASTMMRGRDLILMRSAADDRPDR